MSRDDTDVRRMLADAVPPLKSPPDRLAAVGARVRRRRRRLATGSAAVLVLAVALAAGVPQLVAGHPRVPRPAAVATGGPVGDASCPADLGQRPELEAVRYDDGEPLVPAGAIEVTACQVPRGSGSPVGERIDPRVLTIGVDQIVQLLNALPPTQTGPDGRPRPPADDGLLCTAKWVSAETVFVLRYPDREPVTVWTDENCRVAVAGDRGRGLDFRVFGTFDRFYRAQGNPPR
ncbi:hypothetical protein [Micromonospora sp. NPDC005367]|uniref:hypothetical protein n=1 Tax=Micromonospora sp. NPDC005367 TaxID=3155590 RepID=UPI0033B83F20